MSGTELRTLKIGELSSDVLQNRNHAGADDELGESGRACPSFSIDAMCSTYLNNRAEIHRLLLIYGEGLLPKPLLTAE